MKDYGSLLSRLAGITQFLLNRYLDDLEITDATIEYIQDTILETERYLNIENLGYEV